jgi:hypothetical protein
MIHAPDTPTIPLTSQHNNLDPPLTVPSSPTPTNATTKTTAADSKTFPDRPPAEPPPPNSAISDLIELPPGSILSILANTPQPDSPTTISDFPYTTYTRDDLEKLQMDFHKTTASPATNFITKVQIATCPHVFGLRKDSRSFVCNRK